MDLLPTLLSTGWASGVNAYLTVALLNLLGRAGVGEVPESMQGDAVLVAALAMFAIEFVTDKVPWVDSAWDAVHTVVRPAIAGALGLGFAEADGVEGLEEALAGGGTGAIALASHAVKAGVRLGVNASPEPFTNIGVSLIEDLLVAGVVSLALEHPVEAAVLAGLLLVGGLALVLLVAGRIRRALRSRRGGPPRAGPGSDV
jgi:hypothetical protein